jgi:hypothetical protein
MRWRVRNHWRRWAASTGAAVAVMVLATQPCYALTINFFDGWSSFPGSIGLRGLLAPQQRYLPTPGEQADLFTVMGAAATYWESIIHDPTTVNIGIGYGFLGTSVLGTTLPQEFSPGNIIGAGSIALSAPCHPPTGTCSGRTPWFVDPTPLDSSEFGAASEIFSDLGAGSLNTGRYFEGGPSSGFDMLSVALHEIGHALAGNALSGIFDLPVTDPLPYAGAVLPFNENHLMLPGSLMYPSLEFGRELISDADVLFVAQQRGFTDVTLTAVPVPAAVWLFGSSLGAFGVMRRKVAA